jgi:hypothetical protein
LPAAQELKKALPVISPQSVLKSGRRTAVAGFSSNACWKFAKVCRLDVPRIPEMAGARDIAGIIFCAADNKKRRPRSDGKKAISQALAASAHKTIQSDSGNHVVVVTGSGNDIGLTCRKAAPDKIASGGRMRAGRQMFITTFTHARRCFRGAVFFAGVQVCKWSADLIAGRFTVCWWS